VNVDVCAEHGVWLDRGELPHILSLSNTEVRRHQGEAIRKTKNEGKWSGVILGVWSLLSD